MADDKDQGRERLASKPKPKPELETNPKPKPKPEVALPELIINTEIISDHKTKDK